MNIGKGFIGAIDLFDYGSKEMKFDKFKGGIWDQTWNFSNSLNNCWIIIKISNVQMNILNN